MILDTTKEWEKRETAEELTDIIHVTQEMGQRLALEVNEDLYEDVQGLNHLLQEAYFKAASIRQKLTPK
ncbi:MAG TPA: hypothetical protein VND43_01525 [Burkholderiales bacterium]|nr:hypothetical protein [Pseudomonadota bacterium]HVC48833.1 hypothetical protein [Burkholderiales bacterium]